MRYPNDPAAATELHPSECECPGCKNRVRWGSSIDLLFQMRRTARNLRAQVDAMTDALTPREREVLERRGMLP